MWPKKKVLVLSGSSRLHLISQNPKTEKQEKEKVKDVHLPLCSTGPVHADFPLLPFFRTVCNKWKPWVQVACGLGGETEPWKETHSTSN